MAKKPRIALLTSCTVTRTTEPIVRIENSPDGTMRQVLDDWVEQLDKYSLALGAEHMATPGEIYRGVSMDAVSEIAELIGRENVFIVTGGQGLIRIDEPIVPYDFTSDKGAEHNIHQHITSEKFLPHMWWGMINDAQGRTQYPIAKLLDDDEYDIIIGALPKSFIKYIVSDLQALTEDALTTKVFIPLPASSIGSFPKNIHPALVQYCSSYTNDLGANRYNKAQQVAFKFINQGTTAGSSFMKLRVVMKEQAIKESLLAVTEKTAVDYDTVFKDNPNLLEAENTTIAIRMAKVLGLAIGGRHQFKGAWEGAKGTIYAKIPKDIAEKSKDILAKLRDDKIKKPKSVKADYTDELVSRAAIFVATVRKESPEMVFNSKDLSKWGEAIYGKEDKIGICSAVKMGYILDYHTSHLGLEKVQGGFKVVPQRV